MSAPQGSRRREKSYELKSSKFLGGALLRITLPCVKDVQPRAHLRRGLLVRERRREGKIIELQNSRKPHSSQITFILYSSRWTLCLACSLQFRQSLVFAKSHASYFIPTGGIGGVSVP